MAIIHWVCWNTYRWLSHKIMRHIWILEQVKSARFWIYETLNIIDWLELISLLDVGNVFSQRNKGFYSILQSSLFDIDETAIDNITFGLCKFSVCRCDICNIVFFLGVLQSKKKIECSLSSPNTDIFTGDGKYNIRYQFWINGTPY